MKPIAIFRHLEYEGPGYLADFLDNHQIPHTLIRIDQHDPVPQSISDFSAMVFMGGPMSVNDDLPWIDEEAALIKQAIKVDMPLLGHCLGGQLIARAMGATIDKNPVTEIGWHAVQQVDNPVAHKWLNTLPHSFDVFHWHGETFAVPDGASLLLSSQYCPHQAFAIGNTLALQCHIEMTAPMVKEWAAKNADELKTPSDSLQSAEQMTADVYNRVEKLQPIADVIYQRWIQAL
ncbi:MAG: type 1 glutamine amidotransferase [Gammaproteobacteria bacterium]|jgi:GMP synthase-like glutamine amidotransferase